MLSLRGQKQIFLYRAFLTESPKLFLSYLPVDFHKLNVFSTPLGYYLFEMIPMLSILF